MADANPLRAAVKRVHARGGQRDYRRVHRSVENWFTEYVAGLVPLYEDD
jgi:hypothetical protein